MKATGQKRETKKIKRRKKNRILCFLKAVFCWIQPDI